MYRKVSPQDRKDIVAGLQAGTTVAELSTRYGLSPSYTASLYKRQTGKLLRPVKRLSKAEKAAIVAALHAQTATTTALAAQYGVTPSAISHVYKQAVGRPMRPFPVRTLSAQDKETIIAALSEKKATIKELAGRFAVPRGTISKVFRRGTGKGFGAPPASESVKAAIVAEVQTDKTSTKQEIADKYGVSLATLERIIKHATGKTFRSFHPTDIARKRRRSQADQMRLAAITETLQKDPALTKPALEAKVGIDRMTIQKVIKRTTGKTFEMLRQDYSHPIPLATYLQNLKRSTSRTPRAPLYRAWHKQRHQLYPVLGIDWYHRTILLPHDSRAVWHKMQGFVLMEYTRMCSPKQTPEYPLGQPIYVGDVIQYSILLIWKDGITRRTVVKDVVKLDPNDGSFVAADDLVASYHYECEVIGNIYEHPTLLAGKTWEEKHVVRTEANTA